MAAARLAIVFNLDQLCRPTSAPTRRTPAAHGADRLRRRQLARLRGEPATEGGTSTSRASSSGHRPRAGLQRDRGLAEHAARPPLSIASLRGKVVLVDFWTYSCINCLRTLPHLRAWYAAYHRDGLAIVGVHTPEFAFEHVLANVRAAVHRLGVTWPVALDNNYSTWTAYSNQYWPADYLVDKTGQIREVQLGEGNYIGTEADIRALLGLSGNFTPVADKTPTEETTPETYLGPDRLDLGPTSARRW